MYKQNINFKKQYHSICSDKRRLRYRNLKYLIPILLEDEQTFTNRIHRETLDIHELLTKYKKEKDSKVDRLNLMADGETQWEMTEILTEAKNDFITHFSDPLSQTHELENDGTKQAYEEQETVQVPRYNLRRRAKIDYGKLTKK